MVSAIVCWNVGQAKVYIYIEGRPLYRQHLTLNEDLCVKFYKQKLNCNHLRVQRVS